MSKGFLSSFENASGIDVPNSIAGVDIPDVDLGDLGGLAGDLIDNVSGIGDMVEKATLIRSVLAKGTSTAGDCWGVIDRAYDIMNNISRDIGPLSPLLRLEAMAVSMFNKENLDSCVRIIGEILDLGKLMEKISTILNGLKSIFDDIMEVCGDVVEQVMSFMSDVAQAFAEALHLESALEGIESFFEGVCSLVGELSDISGILSPMLDAWEDANFFEAGAYAFQNFEEAKDALGRVMPGWDESQRLYESARGFGEAADGGAGRAWSTFKPMMESICQMAGVSIPGGPFANDRDAMPKVAPRSGFTPEQESRFSGDAGGGGGGEYCGGDPCRDLYERIKDESEGLSLDKLRWLIEQLGGHDEDEIADMIRTIDEDDCGVIDLRKFLRWIRGDGICDDDRDILLGL